MRPRITIIGAEFPRRHVVFYVSEHQVPFLWSIAVVHNQAAAQLHNDGQRVYSYRAGLHTRLAGGACPQFFSGYLIIYVLLAIRFEFLIGIYVFAYFLQPVAGIHHYFAWREFFAGEVGRAYCGAASTLGT